MISSEIVAEPLDVENIDQAVVECSFCAAIVRGERFDAHRRSHALTYLRPEHSVGPS